MKIKKLLFFSTLLSLATVITSLELDEKDLQEEFNASIEPLDKNEFNPGPKSNKPAETVETEPIKAKPKLGITYGSEVDFTQEHYKSYVKIWILKSKKTSFCGGSLVENNKVVTAAHCFEDAVLLYVCSGSPSCSPWHGHCFYVDPIDCVFVHKGYPNALYDNQMYDDIAVLVLKQSLLTPDSRLIELWQTPDGEPRWFEGMSGIVAGCGKTEHQNKSMAEKLLYADQAIIREDLAYDLYNSIRAKRNRYKVGWTLHPSNSKVSSCNGDSGGPLYVLNQKTGHYMLWGLVSFGTADCESGLPSCYTRVEPYYNFITYLENAIPYRDFHIKYVSKGGRSIALEESFKVRTQVADGSAEKIWKNYNAFGYKIEPQPENPDPKNSLGLEGSIEKKLPFGRCGESGDNSNPRCSVKNLLKALLDFVACEIENEETEESGTE